MTDLADIYRSVAKLPKIECEDVLAYLNFPAHLRRRIRTTNGVERFNQEIKRENKNHPHLPQQGIGIAVGWNIVYGTPRWAGDNLCIKKMAEKKRYWSSLE